MNRVAIGVLGLILFVASGRGAQSASDDPLEVYKAYLGVQATADSLEPLLPYYTKELADGLQKMPKEMQANYLKMNRRTLTDLTVTRRTVNKTEANFELTAKTSDGRRTTGSAKLVKQGDAWKIDDFVWAETPKED
jgi:hypothetical protein